MSEKRGVGLTGVEVPASAGRAAAIMLILGLTCFAAHGARAQAPGAPDAAAGAAPTPATVPATTQATPAAGSPVEDGPAYPVSAFDVRYKTENPSLPSVESLLAHPITLGVINNEYVVPPALERKWIQLQPKAEKLPAGYRGRDIPTRKLTIAEINDEAVDQFHTSAIWAVNEQIKAYLNDRGVIGVYVAPDAAEIDTSGADHRGDKKLLTLVVYTGVVHEVRTVGSGDRVSEANRINNPVHARILA